MFQSLLENLNVCNLWHSEMALESCDIVLVSLALHKSYKSNIIFSLNVSILTE